MSYGFSFPKACGGVSGDVGGHWLPFLFASDIGFPLSVGKPEVGGHNDIMTRMFGYFLSWLQDKTSSVYVIATANNADSLPPELKRKGRFDEIFCVNLPNNTEREAIFKVHLKKKNRDNGIDYQRLVNATSGFNGADIESVVNEAIENCFLRDTKAVTTDELIAVAKKTVSISKSCKQQIENMKKAFAENSFKDATTGNITNVR